MNIAVYGSASGDNIRLARQGAMEVGSMIAERGHVVVSGACPGLPYEASLEAYKKGGKTIGYSPGISLEDHTQRFGFPTKGFSELVFTPKDYQFKDDKWACLTYRNIPHLMASDAAVLISGGQGTFKEFVMAYQKGTLTDKKIPLGVLSGTGGACDYFEEYIRWMGKSSSPQVVFDGNPTQLIIKLEDLV